MTKSRVPRSFDDQLAMVQGKVRVVNFADEYDRMRDGLMYYWNVAEKLHNSANIIWDAGGWQESEVAAMLIGMAIEFLLKGIRCAFELPPCKSHKLDRLCDDTGIAVSENDRIILKALTEHVIWASRYTVPIKREHLVAAQETFDKQYRKSSNLADRIIWERSISLDNCERLWDVFAAHYHRVREARLESVELLRG